ncbi:hypothetical protein [Lacipirellula limnantheis]|uniref:hypothetical protein n=1 Tax=Lacipirellula limnantheis TaxID=2528024 RepID=UPI00143D80C4|nr:hypothetical protein [Lacipirellula limnantheis]
MRFSTELENLFAQLGQLNLTTLLLGAKHFDHSCPIVVGLRSMCMQVLGHDGIYDTGGVLCGCRDIPGFIQIGIAEARNQETILNVSDGVHALSEFSASCCSWVSNDAI